MKNLEEIEKKLYERISKEIKFSFKVWDPNGTQLFSSSVEDHPITAVNWSFSGNHFAVGSFNTVKLCDKTGVSLYYIFIWYLFMYLFFFTDMHILLVVSFIRKNKFWKHIQHCLVK